MITYTSLPGFGPATECRVSGSHHPTPLRFVWHHVQPQEAGGQTVAGNLVEVCDSCHYSIHRLMYALACQQLGKTLTAEQAAELAHPPRQLQLGYAKTGFNACVTAGTVGKIPNEG